MVLEFGQSNKHGFWLLLTFKSADFNSDPRKLYFVTKQPWLFGVRKSNLVFWIVDPLEDSEEIQMGNCQTLFLEKGYLAFFIACGKKNPNFRLIRMN